MIIDKALGGIIQMVNVSLDNGLKVDKSKHHRDVSHDHEVLRWHWVAKLWMPV